MMSALVIILLAISLLLILLDYFKCQIRTFGCRLPPGPPRLPIVGALLFLDAKAPYLTFSQWAQKYGKVYFLWMGGVPVLVLADADVIKNCFARKVFSGRAPLQLVHGIMEGKGLICAEGDLWQSQRKFTTNYMRENGMSNTAQAALKDAREDRMLVHVEEFLQELQPKNNSLDSLLSHVVGNMMNEIIFGMSYEKKDPLWLRLQHLREEGVKHLNVNGALNFLPWLEKLPFLASPRSWIKAGQIQTHREYERIINEIKMKNDDPEDSSDGFRSLTKAFLETRKDPNLKKREHFSNDQLHYLQADIFGAGSDTAAVTFKWVVLYLSKFPSWQERILAEMGKDCGKVVKLKDYNNLNLLNAFVSEVQRLRPVVPLGVPHGTSDRTQILGKWTLPAGCMVVPLQWHINRDKQVWGEDADEFRPQRFIDSEGKFYLPKEFMPFQTGRRKCVGETFGRHLVFLLTSNLVRRFKVTLSKEFQNYKLDQVHDHGFTLTPKKFAVDVNKRRD